LRLDGERLTTTHLVERTHFIARLRRLTEAGGDHSYLIVEVGPCRYIQSLLVWFRRDLRFALRMRMSVR